MISLENVLKPYNSNDIQEGDIYCFSYSFLKDDFSESNLVEVVKDKETGELFLKQLRGGYWKSAYEYIPNDFMTDFLAVRVYRKMENK